MCDAPGLPLLVCEQAGMIRAAIVGLGRWGRALVHSVQGNGTRASDDIRFVRAHTRTRAAAEEFCRDHDLCLVDTYEQILRDADVDAVVLATPTPAPPPDHRRGQRRQAHPRGKADHAGPRQRQCRRNRRAVRRRRAGGRLLPSLSSLRGRFAQARARRKARQCHGPGGARHTTSTGQFVAPDNWRAAPDGGAGRRADRRRRARARSHDRVRRPRARRRCVTSRYLPGPSDDATTVMLTLESGATGLIFCSVATATNFSFTLYGTKGLAEISQPNLARFRFVPGSSEPPRGVVIAPPDEVSEHPDFDMLNAELTEFARCIRDGRPYPIPTDEILHGMSVFDAIVRSARSDGVEKVELKCAGAGFGNPPLRPIRVCSNRAGWKPAPPSRSGHRQTVLLEREGAIALAGRRGDGVEDGRRGDADGRLADAAPEAAGRHDDRSRPSASLRCASCCRCRSSPARCGRPSPCTRP